MRVIGVGQTPAGTGASGFSIRMAVAVNSAVPYFGSVARSPPGRFAGEGAAAGRSAEEGAGRSRRAATPVASIGATVKTLGAAPANVNDRLELAPGQITRDVGERFTAHEGLPSGACDRTFHILLGASSRGVWFV